MTTRDEKMVWLALLALSLFTLLNALAIDKLQGAPGIVGP